MPRNLPSLISKENILFFFFFYSYLQVAYILTTALQSAVHNYCSQAQLILFWGQNLPKYLSFD